MTPLTPSDLQKIAGRDFIIGRTGHIYLDDSTVSRQHAVIRYEGERIYLKDLKSKNGSYLLRHGKLTMFDVEYVSLMQTVVLGEKKYRVIDLLAKACEFCEVDDDTTQIIASKSASDRLRRSAG